MTSFDVWFFFETCMSNLVCAKFTILIVIQPRVRTFFFLIVFDLPLWKYFKPQLTIFFLGTNSSVLHHTKVRKSKIVANVCNDFVVFYWFLEVYGYVWYWYHKMNQFVWVQAWNDFWIFFFSKLGTASTICKRSYYDLNLILKFSVLAFETSLEKSVLTLWKFFNCFEYPKQLLDGFFELMKPL